MKHLIVAVLAVFFVARWGSDTYSCVQGLSKATPFRTQVRAKQCARPGDSIVVLG